MLSSSLRSNTSRNANCPSLSSSTVNLMDGSMPLRWSRNGVMRVLGRAVKVSSTWHLQKRAGLGKLSKAQLPHPHHQVGDNHRHWGSHCGSVHLLVHLSSVSVVVASLVMEVSFPSVCGCCQLGDGGCCDRNSSTYPFTV